MGQQEVLTVHAFSVLSCSSSSKLLSSSLSSESLTQVRPLVLLHASSSAMLKHPPVQASPASTRECLVV